MSRKVIERNISYDETRKLYYVHLDSGKDDRGNRRRTYRTFHPLLKLARYWSPFRQNGLFTAK